MLWGSRSTQDLDVPGAMQRGMSEGKSDLEKLMGYRHSSMPWRSKRDFQLESSSSATPLQSPPLIREIHGKPVRAQHWEISELYTAGWSSCLIFDNATRTLWQHGA